MAGLWRISPLVRPRTYSSREPQTLIHILVSAATIWLKVLVALLGLTYRLSAISTPQVCESSALGWQ